MPTTDESEPAIPPGFRALGPDEIWLCSDRYAHQGVWTEIGEHSLLVGMERERFKPLVIRRDSLIAVPIEDRPEDPLVAKLRGEPACVTSPCIPGCTRAREAIDELNRTHLAAKGYIVAGPSDDLSEVSKLISERDALRREREILHAEIVRLEDITKHHLATELSSGTVRVMLSYDYNHFEIVLTAAVNELCEVDDLRKEATRLAEKAVSQYKIAKANAVRLQLEASDRERLSARVERIRAIEPGQRTVDEAATLKAFDDAQWAASRRYDYEDDWPDDQGDD